LLLRPARRRDPLPGTAGEGAHDQNNGGHTLTRRANAVAAPPDGEQRQLERARLLSIASPRLRSD
jgi:hypothetical protein